MRATIIALINKCMSQHVGKRRDQKMHPRKSYAIQTIERNDPLCPILYKGKAVFISATVKAWYINLIDPNLKVNSRMSSFAYYTAPSTTLSTSCKATPTHRQTNTSSPTPFSSQQDPSTSTARKNNFLIGFIIICIFCILALIVFYVLLRQRRQQLKMSSSKDSSNHPPKLPQRMNTTYTNWKGTPTQGQESGQIKKPAPTFMGYREVSTPAHWFGQMPQEPSEREEVARKRSVQMQQQTRQRGAAARQGTPMPPPKNGGVVEGQKRPKGFVDLDKPLQPAPLIPARGSSLEHLRKMHDLQARKEARALSDARLLFRFGV